MWTGLGLGPSLSKAKDRTRPDLQTLDETECRNHLWNDATSEKSENRRGPSNDNNDKGKLPRVNYSKPGLMDKSGEAEEEERGQGGWETGCAFAFVTHHNRAQFTVANHHHTTSAQTTNPRFVCLDHEIVKRPPLTPRSCRRMY